MNCTKCGKEVLSKITGELCTTCYFEDRKKNTKPFGEYHDPDDAKPEILSTGEKDGQSDNNLESRTADSVVAEDKSIIRAADSRPEENGADTERDNSDKGTTDSDTPKGDGDVEIKHSPAKERELPQPGIKYCQSCIERGFGLNPAEHEWTPGYFICHDCWKPLIDNQVQIERVEVNRIKSEIKCDSPVLSQIYELLEIPETLRFNNTDDVVNNRNDIFIHHAKAIVNMTPEEVKERIEFLQTILFNIRYSIDPYQDYINKEKAKVREESGLAKLEKSKKEAVKSSSKAKLSDEEKMAKSLGMTVERYREAVKLAKEKTFNKIVGK